MVTNTLLTIDEITEDALIVLSNEFIFGNRVLRKFDGSFGKAGAKIGDTLRIRQPIRVTSVTGQAASPQATDETQVPLAVQTQRHVDFQYSTDDLSLKLDEFSGRVIKPAMAQLASDIESDGFQSMFGTTISSGTYAGSYPGVFSLSTPGTISPTTGPNAWTGVDPGTGVNGAPLGSLSGLLAFNEARARLKEQATPNMPKLHCIVPPSVEASMTTSLSGLFQDSYEIAEQYRTGLMGVTAGFIWAESNVIPSFTSGAWHATGNTVTTTSVAGATTLAVTTSGATDSYVVGDKLVVANVHTVNPLTRTSTGKLQVFEITAVATAVSNAVVLSVNPPIQNAGQYQTIDSLPQSGASVTFIGTPSTTTAVSLAFHEEAFALGVAPLAMVQNEGAECYMATDEFSGLSVRYISQYSAQNDLVTRRLDILYGWQAIRPQLACLVQG